MKTGFLSQNNQYEDKVLNAYKEISEKQTEPNEKIISGKVSRDLTDPEMRVIKSNFLAYFDELKFTFPSDSSFDVYDMAGGIWDDKEISSVIDNIKKYFDDIDVRITSLSGIVNENNRKRST